MAFLTLPIDEHIGRIRAHLDTHSALTLIAPPGAGKTTRVPPALLDAAWLGGKKIIVTQPRRVAARAAARRVTTELGPQSPAGLVAHKVRGDDTTTAASRLIYCTEGILTAMLQSDPFLTDVGAVVFDEFHERTLDGDLALAMLRELRADARPELRLIVCSATLDPGPVAEFIGAESIEVPGRVFPVETSYLDKQPHERIHLAVAGAIRQLWAQRPGGEGDLLAFLPGAGEIRRTGEELSKWAAARSVELLALHGELSPAEQDRVLSRPKDMGEGKGRVILATNVAETSLTIEGVTAVVDSGLVKLHQFDPDTGMDELRTVRASRASATQRAGRAGRTRPGVCLRVWTRHDEESRSERHPPEVARADLCRAVLELSAWGHPDPAGFQWFERPDERRLAEASRLLEELGAVDSKGAVTADGASMLAYPLHPRLAKALMGGARLGLGDEAALMCAVFSVRDVSLSSRALARRAEGGGPVAEVHRSDLLHRAELIERAEAVRFSRSACDAMGIDAFAARTAAGEYRRLRRLAGREKITGARPSGHGIESALLELVFESFPDRVAKLDRGTRYVLVGGGGAVLAPSSSIMGEELIVAVKLDAGYRQYGGVHKEARILWGSAVEPRWLEESGLVEEEVETYFDEGLGKALGRRVRRYLDLPLSALRTDADPDEGSRLLTQYVLKDPLRTLPITAKCSRLIDRMGFLNRSLGDEAFPAPEGCFLTTLVTELCYGRTSLKELEKLDLCREITSRFTHSERVLLEKEAPESIPLPCGREATVEYPAHSDPVVRAKIQEVFGLERTPLIGGGRIPVVLHLLGPHSRPLQVTSDLASFWKNGYPEVLKEMRGRYPKHYWPDDPYSAEPTSRTVKRRRS